MNGTIIPGFGPNAFFLFYLKYSGSLYKTLALSFEREIMEIEKWICLYCCRKKNEEVRRTREKSRNLTKKFSRWFESENEERKGCLNGKSLISIKQVERRKKKTCKQVKYETLIECENLLYFINFIFLSMV